MIDESDREGTDLLIESQCLTLDSYLRAVLNLRRILFALNEFTVPTFVHLF